VMPSLGTLGAGDFQRPVDRLEPFSDLLVLIPEPPASDRLFLRVSAPAWGCVVLPELASGPQLITRPVRPGAGHRVAGTLQRPP